MLRSIMRKFVIYTPGFITASLVWPVLQSQAYAGLNLPAIFDIIVLSFCLAAPSVAAIVILNRFGLLRPSEQINN